MRYDPEKHHRRTVRLRGYDYREPGAYFVTICVQGRACVFGEVVEGEMVLSPIGEIARACWMAIPDHHRRTELDAFVVMPNHVHGIIGIVDGAEWGVPGWGADTIGDTIYRVPTGGDTGVFNNGPTVGPDDASDEVPVPGVSGLREQFARPVAGSLSQIMRTYKAAVTRACTRQGFAFEWQPRFYEHIVRNARDLERIRRYIAENPMRWFSDRLYVDRP